MTLHPGFADPVLDSQACFRAVLDAMSRPGRIAGVAFPDPPPPLDPATAAVLLTLADAEASVWLDHGALAAQEWVVFHCGAALAAPGQATFGVALRPVPLAALQAGTDDAPELGATLILQVAALGRGRRLCLSGPGIATTATLLVDGLAGDFVAEWAANHALFPRGIDLILCAGTQVAALPRSTRVAEG